MGLPRTLKNVTPSNTWDSFQNSGRCGTSDISVSPALDPTLRFSDFGDSCTAFAIHFMCDLGNIVPSRNLPNAYLAFVLLQLLTGAFSQANAAIGGTPST